MPARLRVQLANVHSARMLVWDDLKYFLAFARAGSMQAAGKALGVNQSTVQRRISELEERIGRRLVERHLGGYRLTELGEELRPAAEAAEAAITAFERRLAASDKDVTGTIRVTCGSILADRLRRTTLIDTFHEPPSRPEGRAGHQRPVSGLVEAGGRCRDPSRRAAG